MPLDSVLHPHLVACPVGQDPADTLHFRKAQVLTYLDGQGVKPPQHKPGRQERLRVQGEVGQREDSTAPTCNSVLPSPKEIGQEQ